jgi:predicted nuclease of predicted toxin-antitoxin system
MILWVDAQLPPQLARWLEETFLVDAFAVRDLGLRDAEDQEIFDAARQARAVVMTKDKDFVELVQRLGQAQKWQRSADDHPLPNPPSQ